MSAAEAQKELTIPRSEVLLARQPILDREKELFAYELLFRAPHAQSDSGSGVESATEDIGDLASQQVIFNAFTELDIETVIGKHRGFVNFTRNLLMTPPLFDKKRIVIEVLEDVEIDHTVVTQLAALSAQGYTIALDDFVYSEDLAPLVKCADIVKIDVLAVADRLPQQVAALQQFDLKLLAEKVETHEMFHQCRALGFDYFQGYFFARPEVLSGKRTAVSKQATINLIATLQDPDTDFERIREHIAQDTVLTFKLLKLINSAGFYRGHQIDSLQTAINLLGLDQLRGWVTLITLSKFEEKPAALQSLGLVRALFCSRLAEQIDPQKAQICFTAGLLSTIDAFVDQPMAEIFADLPIAEPVKQAVLGYEGLAGTLLASVMHLERQDIELLPMLQYEQWGLRISDITDAYYQALQQAMNMESVLL